MPNYKVNTRMYLPTDPPWRDAPENKTDELKADSPEGIWRQMVIAATARLGMNKEINLFVGLVLNLVNPFPIEVRGAIVNGIITGLGFKTDFDGTTLSGVYETAFPVLPHPEEEPESEPVIDTGVPEDMVRLPSGLIIPGKG